MSTSNTKPTKVLVATFITFFLLGLNKVKSLSDASFDFNNEFPKGGNNLEFEGDTSVSERGILQVSSTKVGRARYVAPVQIWDRHTGRVASFVTSFSFVMKSDNLNRTADGLTFFIARPDSKLGSPGGLLGLFPNSNIDPSYQTVAVEFDTYPRIGSDNAWDPLYSHIGVDVNSIASIKTLYWEKRYGEVAFVHIKYIASSKILIATLTYPSDQTSYILSASVDLRDIVPEFVKVGFSACSTGFETHDVLDWHFTSTFESIYDVSYVE